MDYRYLAKNLTMNKAISFRQNVANNHGEVYRSSAIFYIPPTNTTRTVISFLNYWALKRDINVAIIISTRLMDGSLVKRERIRFTEGQVFNYSPPEDGIFEGSVEVEVLATENMVVPYAAIIAWYETAKGLSIVHSYARTYSLHEIEEGRTHSIGREGCWTISDNALTRSFCVLHNGPFSKEAQLVRLVVTNAEGKKRDASWQMKSLAAYESIKIEPGMHISELGEFLDGEIGQAEIDFQLGGGFTRMLVGNQRLDNSDLQVTHSNFNYTTHATDTAGVDAIGWMEVPKLNVASLEVVVYPQSMQGQYHVTDSKTLEKTWVTGEPVSFSPTIPSTLKFTATKGEFPTRLVTAIRCSRTNERLANECSLGVITELQPLKRLWWGPVRCDEGATSQIVVHDLPQIYKGITDDVVLSLRLFSDTSQTPLETELPASAIEKLKTGMDVTDIWANAHTFLNGRPGYYTLFSPYGGLTVYTLTINRHESVCLEHGF